MLMRCSASKPIAITKMKQNVNYKTANVSPTYEHENNNNNKRNSLNEIKLNLSKEKHLIRNQI